MEPITTKSIGIDGKVFEERRGEMRRRAFKGATLTFNGGYGAFECVVRNISEGGARLTFGEASAVPTRFDLAMSGDVRSRAAVVRWRSLTDVGVEFVPA
ncbi:MAG: PilZ domain-containing protein [Aquamicrobium sp.]|nr:PilZ domain-containing protein [Aquamicrobium sp.]